MSALVVLAILFAVFSLLSLVSLAVAVRRGRWLQGAGKTVQFLLLISLAAFFGTAALGIRGYEALTREDRVARIAVHPAGPQRFSVSFEFPDGRHKVFSLAGDELYVDAHVLKWTAPGNLIGLHTLYELDRVAGRYRDIEKEKTEPRTIHGLSERTGPDLFDLRLRYPFLRWFVDARYGSATFVPAGKEERLVLWVSTTGLLIREEGER